MSDDKRKDADLKDADPPPDTEAEGADNPTDPGVTPNPLGVTPNPEGQDGHGGS